MWGAINSQFMYCTVYRTPRQRRGWCVVCELFMAMTEKRRKGVAV